MAHYHRLVLEAQVDDVDAAYKEAMAVLIAEGDSEADAREQLLEDDGSISPGACLLVLVGPVRKEVGWTFHGGSASPFRPIDADADAERDEAEAEAAEGGEVEPMDGIEATAAKHVTVSFSFKVTDEDRLIEATRVNVGEADEDADRAITLYDAMGEMGPIVAMLAEELLTEMAELGCEITDCHVHDDEDLQGGPAEGYTH